MNWKKVGIANLTVAVGLLIFGYFSTQAQIKDLQLQVERRNTNDVKDIAKELLNELERKNKDNKRDPHTLAVIYGIPGNSGSCTTSSRGWLSALKITTAHSNLKPNWVLLTNKIESANSKPEEITLGLPLISDTGNYKNFLDSVTLHFEKNQAEVLRVNDFWNIPAALCDFGKGKPQLVADGSVYLFSVPFDQYQYYFKLKIQGQKVWVDLS